MNNELKQPLPSTGHPPHFSSSRDGATQEGYPLEHISYRWMHATAMHGSHSVSLHEADYCDGTKLAENTLIPMKQLKLTSKDYYKQCTGEDGDGATRIKRVSEKFVSMIGKTKEFQIFSNDISHLYSKVLSYTNEQIEGVNAFTEQFITCQTKFSDERSMIFKDMSNLVPNFVRQHKYVEVK